MRFIRLLLLLGIVSLTIQFCDNPEAPGTCTDEHVMYDLTVLNLDGEPADSVDITVQSQESGKVFPVCEQGYCDHTKPGNYIIMHDSFMEELSNDGEVVLVEGTKAEREFEQEFIFQGSDGCHVAKIAGPDTVSLQ